MNGDHRYYHPPSSNAVAGPSKPPQMPSPHQEHASPGGTASTTAPASGPSSSPQHHQSAPVDLFLPPPGPPLPRQHLKSTQDLLARFHLHPAYDRYVRPNTSPGNDAQGTGVGAGQSGGPGDKGKGKEVDPEMGGAGASMGSEGVPGAGDGEDEDGARGKGEKKLKNTYKHLIKGLPGKHSLKSDDYLSTIMQIPPKQRIRISHFDEYTQQDAFAVTPEGLKGWNIHALVMESAQAREDRRKRKELKKLAKQQQALASDANANAHPSVPLQAPAPTPAQTATFKPQGSGAPTHNPSTPRSAAVGGGTPRPGSSVARPGSSVSRVGTPAAPPVQAIPNSTKSSIARPGSAAPRPAPGVVTAGLTSRPGSARPSPIVPSQAASIPHGDMPRGQKRQREEGAQVNGQPVVANGNGNGMVNGGTNGVGYPVGAGLPPKPVIGAKAGSGGVRPRPVKKQRMDANGTVQQQPTPQGV